MPEKTVLALDLGPTSIGWAFVNETEARIIATGVCVFPEGVDRDTKGAEKPKGQQRRIARGMRRQVARRARRKRVLRDALVSLGLLPLFAARPATDPKRVAWEASAFAEADPYMLRHRALTQKLELHDLGRVFLHLAQHRGFLSNRMADRARKKETSDMETEMNALQVAMNDAGHRTLGEHFAVMQEADPAWRIRGRHTRRDMYQREFDAIWEAQSAYYPTLLTNELKFGLLGKPITYPCLPTPCGGTAVDRLKKFGLHGLIFFQRALYWPTAMIGRCEIDPKQKRCPRADRIAQQFRVFQEVNNLKIITTDGEVISLTADQREAVIDLLSRKKEVTFDEVRKLLKLPDGTGFNLESGERKKLLGMVTDALLAGTKLFGKAWNKRSELERNAIVRALIDDNEDEFRHRAVSWGIDAELADKLLDVNLPDGYSSYGRETIEKLLPHLRDGLPLTAEVGRESALSKAGFLAPWERPRKAGDFLPVPPKVTNPIVRQALFTLRRLVNAVVMEHGKPDVVHIELAREAKGNAVQRAQATHRMREREASRAFAADKIREFGDKPTKEKIDKYLLWQEQREMCIYSGRPISLTQLLGGEVDIDHLLPYSKSLDNSMINKVVCFRDENQLKGQRTVHEWLAATDPNKYDKILQRANRLPTEIRNAKLPRFSRPSCQIEDFLNRHLTDTAYITRLVNEYLKSLVPDVVATKGQFTAELRHQWGLNEVLRDDGLNLKNREDHRHHAVDAIVIAFTDRSRLQNLARFKGQSALPVPWTDFRSDVETVVNDIKVWHRPRVRIVGPLHEDTLYGATQKLPEAMAGPRPWAKNWVEEPGVYVLRKPLEQLSLSEVERIRDERIREVVRERLGQFGLSGGRKKKGTSSGSGKIPSEVWKEPLYLTPRNGRGERTVIRRVRLTKPEDSVVPLRNEGRTCVKPGNLHHVAIFEVTQRNGKIRRVAQFVSMLEAARRKRDSIPVIQRTLSEFPDARFVMSLCRGETVLGEFKNKTRLVRFSTAASTQGQLYFVDHTDAQASASVVKFAVKAGTLKAEKVLVDLLGRIQPAK